jgi:hypothetical protein
MLEKEMEQHPTGLVPVQSKLKGDWAVSINIGESEIDAELSNQGVPQAERTIPPVRAFAKNSRSVLYLQNQMADASDDPRLPRRLGDRYFGAEQLLRATRLVLSHDPDELAAPDHAEYLLGKINNALAAFGLEVVKREQAPAPPTPLLGPPPGGPSPTK